MTIATGTNAHDRTRRGFLAAAEGGTGADEPRPIASDSAAIICPVLAKRFSGVALIAGERFGKIRTNVEQRESFAGCVRREELRKSGAFDWILLRQQIEQHDADGVDVARGRRRRAEQQLRRHVSGCAARIFGSAVLVREAEIHQENAAVGGSHHILRFDVPV